MHANAVSTFRRVRFGVFLVIALLLAVQLVDGAAAGPLNTVDGATSAVFSSSRVVTGDADVSTFDIRGAGAALFTAPGYDRVLGCNPCSARFHVVESDVLIVSGTGTSGLASDTTYHVGAFHGTIGIRIHGPGDFTLSFDGTADSFG